MYFRMYFNISYVIPKWNSSQSQGQYQLKLSYWSPSTGTGAAGAAQRHCAALLGTVALLAAKGKDTSNYRQERGGYLRGFLAGSSGKLQTSDGY